MVTSASEVISKRLQNIRTNVENYYDKNIIHEVDIEPSRMKDINLQLNFKVRVAVFGFSGSQSLYTVFKH